MLDNSPRPLVASFPQPSDYAEYDELLELMAEDRRRRALDAAGLVQTIPGPLVPESIPVAVTQEQLYAEPLMRSYPTPQNAKLPVYRNQMLRNLVQPTTGSHKRRRALAKRHRLWCRRVARWATQAQATPTRKQTIKKGLTR